MARGVIANLTIPSTCASPGEVMTYIDIDGVIARRRASMAALRTETEAFVKYCDEMHRDALELARQAGPAGEAFLKKYGKEQA